MAKLNKSTSTRKKMRELGAGASKTNRKGETTYYKSAKDAPGYYDSTDGKVTQSAGNAPLASYDAKGQIITADKLKPAPIITAPTKTTFPDVGNMAGANNQGLAGGLTSLYSYDPVKGFVPNANSGTSADTSGLMSIFNQVQSLREAPESDTDIYNKEYKRSGVKEAEQNVQNYTSQLNTIIANRDANLLQLRGTGSREGVTEAVYGGQQATVNREAAISALPVQAALASAQGNLELAQTHLDTMFKLKSSDAKAKYDYNNKVLDSIYNFATGIEQKRLDALKTKEDRAYTREENNRKLLFDLASQAVEYGKGSLVSSITGIDPASANFDTLYGSILGRVTKPVAAVSAPEPKNFGTSDNPMWGIYDSTTNSIKPIGGGGGASDISTPQGQREYDTKKATLADDVSRATSLLGNSLGIKGSAGTYQPDFFGGLFTGAVGIKQEDGIIRNLTKYVPLVGNIMSASYSSTQKDDFLSGVSYIVNNQTFDKLVNLKQDGATFGALSDSERVAIGRAATDLAASTINDESGNITGFRGSEKKLVENLTKVLEGYRAAQDQLNIDYGVAPADVIEASNYWNNN